MHAETVHEYLVNGPCDVTLRSLGQCINTVHSVTEDIVLEGLCVEAQLVYHEGKSHIALPCSGNLFRCHQQTMFHTVTIIFGLYLLFDLSTYNIKNGKVIRRDILFKLTL